MIVVDAEVLANFWLMTKRTPATRQLYQVDPRWAVPYLWRTEVRQILSTFVQHGDLTWGDACWLVEHAEEMVAGYEYQVPSAEVLRLAEATGAAVQTCEYVALAQQLGVALITGSTAVAKAFPDTAVLLEHVDFEAYAAA